MILFFILLLQSSHQQKIPQNPVHLMNSSMEALVSSFNKLHVEYLEVILYEALNRKQFLPVADEQMAHTLIGEAVVCSSAAIGYNLDQTNPLQQYSQYAQLVSEFLPPKLLATKTGLSSLLSYMGTGSEILSFLNILQS